VIPPARSISLTTATCLVIANMVGTGVFTSLGFQVGSLPAPWTILVLWLVGGLCAWCGALCYGELAAALPRSGGEYHFLSEIFHPTIGFLAGWISLAVGFSAPIALAGMAFGKYFHTVFPSIHPLAAALPMVLLIAAIHFRGTQLGSLFQNTATALKILLILFLVGAGWIAATPQPISFAVQTADAPLLLSPSFAVSLVYVMYAYSGWNASTYIAGELRNPGRDLPRSVAIGTAFVALLYLALNATFLRVAPMQEMAGKVEVGQIAAAHIFGPLGGRIMAALICAGLVSSISAMTWVGPRVTMAMGEDWPLLGFLAHRNAHGVPAKAIALQTALVILLLTTSSFEAVLTYLQFALCICSFLTVVGVFVLRWRQPLLHRPYRTWGYPITPLVFLAVNAWILWHIATGKPTESIAGLATILAGILVARIKPGGNRSTTPAAPTPTH